jgi:hypothetical protein
MTLSTSAPQLVSSAPSLPSSRIALCSWATSLPVTPSTLPSRSESASKQNLYPRYRKSSSRLRKGVFLARCDWNIRTDLEFTLVQDSRRDYRIPRRRVAHTIPMAVVIQYTLRLALKQPYLFPKSIDWPTDITIYLLKTRTWPRARSGPSTGSVK